MSTTSESDFIPLPSQASCARPKIGGKKGTNPALPISLGISISESWFLPQPRVKPNHCMYHNQNHFHGRMWDSSCISYLVAKDQGAYVCVCDCVCVCAYIYICLRTMAVAPCTNGSQDYDNYDACPSFPSHLWRILMLASVFISQSLAIPTLITTLSPAGSQAKSLARTKLT